jgi:hypothetical protein
MHQRWPSAPCVAKPVVGNSVGGLTPHGESPAVLKRSEGKAMDFGSLGGLGTGEEARRQTLWSSKRRGYAPGSNHAGERPGC